MKIIYIILLVVLSGIKLPAQTVDFTTNSYGSRENRSILPIIPKENTDTLKSPFIATSGKILPDSILNNGILIYPNPCEDILMCDLEKRSSASYKIYDNTGQTVISGDLMQSKNDINVFSLNKGIYIILIIFEDNSTHIFKFSKV